MVNHKVRQRTIARSREALPPGSVLVTNILNVYDAATDAELVAGRNWYNAANALVGGDPCRAGALAALSPACSWDQNVAAYLNLAAGNDEWRSSRLFIERASRCLDGEDPEDVLGGRKVRSFYYNIARPSHHGAVTVDRHSVGAALGAASTADHAGGVHRVKAGRYSDGALRRILARRGTYTVIAAAYRAAARRRGVNPNQLQAVTWLTFRRITENPAGLSAAQLDEEF